MLSFKTFLKENDMNYNEVEKTLKDLGYTVKQITRNRIAIVTDARSAAIKNVLNTLKGSRIVKDAQALNISSLGVIHLPGSIQIIVKPATKNVLKAEQEATESLIGLIRTAVEQEGKPIDIFMGRFKASAVVTAGADQIKGDPKADIALIDNSNREVGFISHKKEGGAKAFQQYSGISKDAGDSIYDDSLVVDYVKELYNTVNRKFGDNKGRTGFSTWREIPDTPNGRKLASRSVYGPEWDGGRTFGRESVHCIGQGAPILTRQQNGSYKLTFSESMHTADEIDWIFRGDYKIIFASTYRSARATTHDGVKVGDMRSGIYPYDFIRNRKTTRI